MLKVFGNSLVNNISQQHRNYFSERVSFTSQADEFVKSEDNEEKKGLSKKAKWGIAGGIGVGALIAFYIAKGKFTEAKKLAESIDFKPAQTIEEAIEFGKKHLGIKNYSGFEAKDLHVVNWINEGLVNTSNKLKGNVRMPKSICYADKNLLGKNTLAGVINSKGHKFDGWFGINKGIFDNIDKSIEEQLINIDNVIKFKKNDKGEWIATAHSLLDEASVRNLLKEFIKYKEGNFTFKQKLNFYSSIDVVQNACNSINESPLNVIKQILKNSNSKKICQDNNLTVDIEQIKKLSTKQQLELLEDMINCDGINIKLTFDIKSLSAFNTIYHEMGHLQDMIPRCNAIDKFKNPSEYPKELNDWLNNEENMQIANRISSYATTGPGEFIAETFARMIQGNKLPDEVIALYKKLKGPAVPGY